MADTFLDEDDVEIIDPSNLPDDDAEFDPCEEGDNFEALVGALGFGTTSRQVLATWLPAAFKKWASSTSSWPAGRTVAARSRPATSTPTAC